MVCNLKKTLRMNNQKRAPLRSKGCFEYLEVEYAEPVFVTGIDIYETYNPGAVIKVSLKNPATEEWVAVYVSDDFFNLKT